MSPPVPSCLLLPSLSAAGNAACFEPRGEKAGFFHVFTVSSFLLCLLAFCVFCSLCVCVLLRDCRAWFRISARCAAALLSGGTWRHRDLPRLPAPRSTSPDCKSTHAYCSPHTPPPLHVMQTNTMVCACVSLHGANLCFFNGFPPQAHPFFLSRAPWRVVQQGRENRGGNLGCPSSLMVPYVHGALRC